MRVKLAVDMSGSRNGVPWPKRGSVVDLPDHEAEDMLTSGVVVLLDDDEDGDVETAVLKSDDEETRTGLTKDSAPALVSETKRTTTARTTPKK